MISSNVTNYKAVTFVIVGIPGLEIYNSILSAPLFIMFVCALIGNSLIIFILILDRTLRSPMYFFLYLLALTDLFLSITITPKLLGVFWFNARETNFDSCLIQMFFVHFLSFMESGVLVAMSLDRYVAICHPLRYIIILTNPLLAKIATLVVLRGVAMVTPCFYLVTRLPYCGKSIIVNAFCDHMSMAKASCADTSINSIYGLFQTVMSGGIDISCIGFSYMWILRAVLSLPTRSEHSKAFSTCTSHICVITLFYIPGFFSLLTYRFSHNVPPAVHSIMSILYLLMPPTFNPIVYGVKTKQIRGNVQKFISQNKQLF